MKASQPPPDHEKTLSEWAKHWPFTRASPELIRRAQAVHRQQTRMPVGDPAPF